ncbi:PREDICTED: uncharacterized protein LOC109150345 [Ipomoea nil]|uniref:uncharacterized protein LOC109150345 n=1 Tax=Ipomoea nil TaxID=35883 RepID=UPI000900E785|nr:PREDICTED: uncharacterized protein LOC109150345 [Ipomoea nil]
MWRCLRGILPVREVLKEKRVYVGGGCPLCAASLETIVHILCECPLACQLWGAANVLHGYILAQFVEENLCHQDESQAVAMTCRFWVMWKVQNDVVWNGKLWSISQMQAYVSSELMGWEEAVFPNYNSHHSGNPYQVWVPPPFDFLKCNIDAALHGQDASFGAILRNHNGEFIAACVGRLMGASNAYLAEALAFKEALSCLKSRSESFYFIESDWNMLVRHVRRSTNQVAHVLALATGPNSVLTVWETIPPACVLSLL